MTRITFTHNGRASWFSPDAAREVVSESRTWDGQNLVGSTSGLQTNRAVLYLTRGGRWVEHVDASHEFDGPDTYRYLTDNQARDWLTRSAEEAAGGRAAERMAGEDAERALAKHFGDVGEETDSETDASQGGRPPIGPTINVAYPREVLTRIEDSAAAEGISRAAWLRKIAQDAVS